MREDPERSKSEELDLSLYKNIIHLILKWLNSQSMVFHILHCMGTAIFISLVQSSLIEIIEHSHHQSSPVITILIFIGSDWPDIANEKYN